MKILTIIKLLLMILLITVQLLNEIFVLRLKYYLFNDWIIMVIYLIYLNEK